MSMQSPGLEDVRRALEAAARLPKFKRSSAGRSGPRAARSGAAAPLDPRGVQSAVGGASGGTSQAQPKPDPRNDVLVRLVQRITQGLDPLDVAHARTLGYDAYLEEQLDHLAIDDSALDARLAPLTTLGMSPRELVEGYGMNTFQPVLELQKATLLRSLYSKRQLFERTCEFWTDHFNVHYGKGIVWALHGQFDRDAIRANALGSLHDLLVASATSPAMLTYLDNWLNYAGAPQENYARELLELHSMGASSGYTEGDVHEVARCFTGWTLDFSPTSNDYLGFRFRPGLHEPGSKLVLGNVIDEQPSAGWAGFRVLEILCARPETARHVVGELISWFLTPTPPPELVEANAQLFLDSSGDIKPVLRSILARENMRWASPVLAPKFRRPFHFLNALLRTLHAQVTDAGPLVEHLASMGQAPHDWPTPAGYPDSVEAWGSSLLPRWTFASELLAGHVPGVMISTASLLAYLEVAGPLDRPGLAQRVNRKLLADSLSREEERLVQELVDSSSGPFGWQQVSEVIALAVSMPGFQWY